MSGHWPDVDRRLNDRRLGDRRLGDRRGDDRQDGFSAAGSRRTHVGLFLFVVACIIYGTLYPFQPFDRGDNLGAIVFLLNTAGEWDRQTNLVASILLYAAFAFLGMFALPSGIHARIRVMMTLGGGIILSVWLELAQYQDVGHTPTMGDVYASGVGLMLGIAVASIAQRQRTDLMRDLGAGHVQVVLLLMWAGDRAYPYEPTLGGHNLWHAVAPLMDLSSIDWLNLARGSVRWLMVACLVDSMFGGRRWVRVFPLLMLAEFVARLLLVGRTLTPTDTGGAVVALIVWPAIRWLPMSRFLLLGAFAALVVVVRLAPFEFIALPNTFDWLPFKSLMHAPLAMGVRRVFADGFLYGGLIWLLTLGGLRVGVATAITALMLLGLSVAQTWQPGPPGEITDALVALAIGGVLFLLQDGTASSPSPAA